MCYHYRINKSAKQIEERFEAEMIHHQQNMFFDGIVNGFNKPLMPIICKNTPDQIEFARWGLIPGWVKDLNTFKANRQEELKEKPSYRGSINNRCIVPADAFQEWHWIDPKGKNKEKYLMFFDDLEIFSFPGIFSDWKNPETGEIIRSYTLLTTVGTGIMKEIHNADPEDPRMVMVLNPDYEKAYLESGKLEIINDNLKAKKIS